MAAVRSVARATPRWLAGTLAVLGLLAGRLEGATLRIDLLQTPPGQLPEGFRSAVAGEGPPGQWRLIRTEPPAYLAPLTQQGARATHPALAQVSSIVGPERFPLLIYEPEVFRDFTLRARVKMLGGEAEQMAGLAFRLQDERSFYVVRASAKGDTFRFYRVVEGVRGPPIGVDTPIETNRWYELSVTCTGNRIRLALDQRQLIPELTDNTFREGRFALWTMSDSVSCFTDIRVDYTPRTTLAEELVTAAMQKYRRRLLAVTLYGAGGDNPELRVVAASDPALVGRPAGEVPQKVIAENQAYFGRSPKRVIVTVPLRDRNGDPVAAVRLEMDSFPGETDRTALVRARPIVQEMQRRILNAEDLLR